MEEDRMHKKIFTQELEGTRRRGRPRKGWREEVDRQLCFSLPVLMALEKKNLAPLGIRTPTGPPCSKSLLDKG
jgi:hypothetical protein